MSHGQITVYTQTMASGATSLTSYFDLGRSFDKVYLEVPTFASGTDVYIQGSSDGSTFRRIYREQVSTSIVAADVWKVGSAASQAFHRIPAGFRYYRPEVSTALTDTVTPWKMVCSD